MSKKSIKKRRSKVKFKRLYIIISILLALSLISGLFFISFKHFSDKKQTQEKKETIVKKEKPSDKNTKNKETATSKAKNVIKFNKDENLTQIFKDPKHNDETYALKQTPKESTKKKDLNRTRTEPSVFALNDINVTNTKKQNITKEQNATKEIKANKNLKDENLSKIYNEQSKSNKINEAKNNTKKTNTKNQEQIKKTKDTKAINTKSKPKLAIIIDDVANRAHVNMMHSTKIKKLTPSFFPKNRLHPDTPNLAKEFGFFMIHLPMQANNFAQPEIDTLNITDSFESIEKKIIAIKKDFPTAKFINNHTGSKFTSNFNAMDMAYRAFLKHGFIFLDSRTISTTKVKSVAKKYNKPYFFRDVFLDDKDDKTAIKAALLSAIKIAKEKGYAIAIGHPRKNTIDVLKENREFILENVEVVYPKDIYEFYR